jgi:hypothetical protein
MFPPLISVSLSLPQFSPFPPHPLLSPPSKDAANSVQEVKWFSSSVQRSSLVHDSPEQNVHF